MTFGWRDLPGLLSAVARGQSPFRALQQAYLRQLRWTTGLRVLDVGSKPEGGKVDLAYPGIEVVYSNLDGGSQGVVALDITKPFPADLDRFDRILMLNVLEHVYDAETGLHFARQGLQPNGELVVITPYLYPYHRAPLDYFRPSLDWFEEAARRSGLKLVEPCPLSLGAASDVLGYSVSLIMFSRCSVVLRPLLAAIWGAAIVVDLTIRTLAGLAGKHGRSYLRNPLGYAAVLTVAAPPAAG